MAHNNDFGKKAEDEAVDFLVRKNFQILDRNWRYGKAEIDIIAKKGKKLHIVEVKARTSERVLLPEESVNTKKIKLLLFATNAYVCSLNESLNIQFDIISIIYNKYRFQLRYIEDAFNSVN